jgi:hypothetical protein
MDAELAEAVARYADEWLLRLTGKVALGESLNPTLYFWAPLISNWRAPFIKRDLVMFNPIKTPELLLVREVVKGSRWAGLRNQVRPLLPSYPNEIYPVLRITEKMLES